MTTLVRWDPLREAAAMHTELSRLMNGLVEGSGRQTQAWVPTLELTVHLRKHPKPGWLRAVFQTRVLRDGLLEEDGELWDADGDLVAMSRQLATVIPAEE